MEQELRKCVFDERGTGMVYLQNITTDEQVHFVKKLTIFILFCYFSIFQPNTFKSVVMHSSLFLLNEN